MGPGADVTRNADLKQSDTRTRKLLYIAQMR